MLKQCLLIYTDLHSWPVCQETDKIKNEEIIFEKQIDENVKIVFIKTAERIERVDIVKNSFVPIYNVDEFLVLALNKENKFIDLDLSLKEEIKNILKKEVL